MKAISVRQPWAWLLLHARKDIENRTWATDHRGATFLHASKGMTREEYSDCLDFLQADPRLESAFRSLPAFDGFQQGGVIGEITITECVKKSASPWFTGPYGFVVREPKVLPFWPCKGALGFFELPDE